MVEEEESLNWFFYVIASVDEDSRFDGLSPFMSCLVLLFYKFYQRRF